MSSIDLRLFYQVFFEEAAENLEQFERMLLNVDIASADDEELNAIFRCAHSVKGGAATFGFQDIAELTHEMETLLDKLRRHELSPTREMVDVLLQSGDLLREQLARHEGKTQEIVDTRAIVSHIAELARGEGQPAGVLVPLEAGPAADPVRDIELHVGPLEDPKVADTIEELFRDIPDIGTIEPLDSRVADAGMRRFLVRSSSSEDELLALLSFHVAQEQLRFAPHGAVDAATPGPLTDPDATADPGYGFFDDAPGAPGAAVHGPASMSLADPAAPSGAAADANLGYGFFDDAPGAPSRALPPLTDTASATPLPGVPEAAGSSLESGPARQTDRRDKAAVTDTGTLRVSVEKVDQLINLVGELVITQAMLAQNEKSVDAAVSQQLASGLADLARNTRDLQEAVMSIRMIPMSMVFNRFPRMLRDLAARLGKKVDLVTQGEATELDKGLVEKITDPLTHLVRNSCDHGIESAEERRARGKPEHGTITLIASHQGGSIVIEVRDDGRGLNRAKLLTKARERGIEVADTASDAEVWGLIFAPGFSTAEQVTDVSGRGVGMDVVKKNILALGGTVEIDSAMGYGMTVRVRLPLTLAIMDGMSVGVGDECYILPLSSVVESFQVQPGMIRTIGGSCRVVDVRDVYMPVVDLEQLFGVPRFDFERSSNIMVVVEAEGRHVALLVDALLGQQQIVVKNLEANYRKVEDVSGATILGDGKVALILDVSSLVRRAMF